VLVGGFAVLTPLPPVQGVVAKGGGYGFKVAPMIEAAEVKSELG
jgi:hypothetical protein